MSAFDKYIDALVNDEEPEEFGAFPKNESTREELFDFGKDRINDIVKLKKENKYLMELISKTLATALQAGKQ